MAKNNDNSAELNAKRLAQDEAFMREALAEARLAADVGEVPIGAVVVYEPIDRATRRALAEPRIISRAHNLRETLKSPSAHAEFLAMEAAARELDAWRLTDCTVYVTLEPCIMCAGAMHQARIARCVWGAPDQKAGALGTLYNINSDERLNHNFASTGGVLAEESRALLQEFFRSRR
jgi:tRNA(adenine34) deaminase